MCARVCNVCVYMRLSLSLPLSLSFSLSIYLSLFLSSLSIFSICASTDIRAFDNTPRTKPRTKSTALHCIAQASVLARARLKLRSLYITLRMCTFVHKNS